jgi:hypothetical protein
MSAGIDFDVRQEEDRVHSPSLIRVAVVSLVVGAVGVLVAGLVLHATTGALRLDLAGREGPRAVPRSIAHVEQTPIWTARVGLDLREAQRRELGTWGWTDRSAGVARIPIDRAIDIVAKEGSR